MYEGKTDGLAAGTEYIRILARRASAVFAVFSGLATWQLHASWQWTGALAAAYAVYSLFVSRRQRAPGVGEFFASLIFCAGLTLAGAEFSGILYYLLLLRMTLHGGRRRARRLTVVIAGVYVGAVSAVAPVFGGAFFAETAFCLVVMAVMTHAAVKLDILMTRQQSEDQQVAELIKQNDRNYRMALTDALTGLYNHRAYKERIDTLSQYALFVIDIDHFKKLNDAHGHLIGDKVLVGLGNIIKLSIRSGDLAFRYGGEEFVVVLPGTTAPIGLKIAERLRQRVADWNFEGTAGRIPVTVSIGMSMRKPGMTSQAVFEEADQALYRAKQSGRNNVKSAVKTGPDTTLKYGM